MQRKTESFDRSLNIPGCTSLVMNVLNLSKSFLNKEEKGADNHCDELINAIALLEKPLRIDKELVPTEIKNGKTEEEKTPDEKRLDAERKQEISAVKTRNKEKEHKYELYAATFSQIARADLMPFEHLQKDTLATLAELHSATGDDLQKAIRKKLNVAVLLKMPEIMAYIDKYVKEKYRPELKNLFQIVDQFCLFGLASYNGLQARIELDSKNEKLFTKFSPEETMATQITQITDSILKLIKTKQTPDGIQGVVKTVNKSSHVGDLAASICQIYSNLSKIRARYVSHRFAILEDKLLLADGEIAELKQKLEILLTTKTEDDKENLIKKLLAEKIALQKQLVQSEVEMANKKREYKSELHAIKHELDEAKQRIQAFEAKEKIPPLPQPADEKENAQQSLCGLQALFWSLLARKIGHCFMAGIRFIGEGAAYIYHTLRHCGRPAPLVTKFFQHAGSNVNVNQSDVKESQRTLRPS